MSFQEEGGNSRLLQSCLCNPSLYFPSFLYQQNASNPSSTRTILLQTEPKTRVQKTQMSKYFFSLASICFEAIAQPRATVPLPSTDQLSISYLDNQMNEESNEQPVVELFHSLKQRWQTSIRYKSTALPTLIRVEQIDPRYYLVALYTPR